MVGCAWSDQFYKVKAAFSNMYNSISWLLTRSILLVIYFSVFLVVGAILKIAGFDPMMRRFDRNIRSYRVPSRSRQANHMKGIY
jgi:hypothetical protein